MIRIERFNEILSEYKKYFTQEHWDDEKFKWEAIKRLYRKSKWQTLLILAS